MKTGERAMTKFMGLLCLNPLWGPSSSLPELSAADAAAAEKAIGEAIAPARSCEKERQSAAASEPKKLETRVMGPGLAPAAAEKKASAEGRGGSVMVGRGGGAVPESVLGVDIGGRWMATK